jgi:hypothetical protein
MVNKLLFAALSGGLALLVGFGILAGYAQQLTGQDSSGSHRNDQGFRIVALQGIEASSAGILIRLTEASFSSSETRFKIEFTGLANADEVKAFSSKVSFHIKNAEDDASPLVSSIQLNEFGLPETTVSSGRIIDVFQPVTLTFSDATTDSQWVLSFIPGEDAVDPIDQEFVLNRRIEYSNFTIVAHTLHASSTQLRLKYDIEAPGGVSPLPVDYIATIEYSDGTIIHGSEAAQANGGLSPSVSHNVDFPAERDIREKFVIRFGNFVSYVADAAEYRIPLSQPAAVSSLVGDPTSIPTDTPSNSSFPTDTPANSRFLINVDEGDMIGDSPVISLRVSLPPGESSFISYSMNNVSLTDNLGNSYTFRHGYNGFRKSQDGDAIPDRSLLQFNGTIAPSATELVLRTPDSARVLGPMNSEDIIEVN